MAEASAAVTEARVAAAAAVATVAGTGTRRRPLLRVGSPRALPAGDMSRHTVRYPLATAVASRSPGRASPPRAGWSGPPACGAR
ncbi:hypothetical protein HDG35_003545 [Paraburkholderia sp. JPY681]|nr:hypothetical protein [Paraburkholderia atlantica]